MWLVNGFKTKDAPLSVKLTQVPKGKRFQSVSKVFPAFPDLAGAFPDLLP